MSGLEDFQTIFFFGAGPVFVGEMLIPFETISRYIYSMRTSIWMTMKSKILNQPVLAHLNNVVEMAYSINLIGNMSSFQTLMTRSEMASIRDLVGQTLMKSL